MTLETLPMVFPDDAPRARRDDPLASHEAADANDTAGSRLAVLAVLGATTKPLADFEIESTHRTFTLRPYTGQRLRTARKELVTAKTVVCDGTTFTPNGRRTQTWRLA